MFSQVLLKSLPQSVLAPKQHALYQALKAFRQVPKSLFILQVIDDPVPRQATEKQLEPESE